MLSTVAAGWPITGKERRESGIKEEKENVGENISRILLACTHGVGHLLMLFRQPQLELSEPLLWGPWPLAGSLLRWCAGQTNSQNLMAGKSRWLRAGWGHPNG